MHDSAVFGIIFHVNAEQLSDHEIYELLKLQDDLAWRMVWEKAVLAEVRSLRSSRMAAQWGVSAEELMGVLYEEMIGRGKIDLFRDDGGSLWGWLRQYVRGYIRRANPAARREVSLEGMGDLEGADGQDGPSFEEKVSKMVSDSRGRDANPTVDPAVRRQEEWDLVQQCFGTLWKENPLRAYVHLLKLRLNLSSTEIKNMLGISSEANVDQLFSRAVKDMRKLKDEHEKCE